MDDWIASTLAQVNWAEHRARVGRSNSEGWRQPVRLRRRGPHAAREALAAALVTLAQRLAPAVGGTVDAPSIANGAQR